MNVSNVIENKNVNGLLTVPQTEQHICGVGGGGGGEFCSKFEEIILKYFK